MDPAATVPMQEQGNLEGFDVIHAEHFMVDKVGVLNVLLCCGRLLYP